jgi:hypothetical protein
MSDPFKEYLVLSHLIFNHNKIEYIDFEYKDVCAKVLGTWEDAEENPYKAYVSCADILDEIFFLKKQHLPREIVKEADMRLDDEEMISQYGMYGCFHR